MTSRRSAVRWALALGIVLAAGSPGLLAQQAEPTEEADRAEQAARTIEVKILGMSCPFCAYGVERKLKRLEGVEALEVALESGVATLEMAEGADLSNQTLLETVEDAGFEVETIRRSFESEHPDYPSVGLPRGGERA